MPQDSRVAIIGGGLSGLVCAQELARQGVRSVVFDTGEHGVGGRLATRAASDASLRPAWLPQGEARSNAVFDHAAQCFTATDGRLQAMVDAWVDQGVVSSWQGAVGELRAGKFTPWAPHPTRYVAVGGMRCLAQHLASQAMAAGGGGLVEVRRPLWVARMSAQQREGGWRLSGNGGADLGLFDAVVIAHNGKCANRLVGPTGAPLVAKQLMRLRLSAVWVAMLAFEAPLDVPGGMEGASVAASPDLSWAANNTAKLGLVHPGRPGMQCWTLISSAAYGAANKVPQERVPPDVSSKVSADLAAALADALGGARLPPVLLERCQLWGAALPLNSPRTPCILDAASRVGVCGDWLLGGGVQAAALSGLELAERLAGLRCLPTEAAGALSVGLREEFTPLRLGSDIGEFPGLAQEGGGSGGNGGSGGAPAAAVAGRRRQPPGTVAPVTARSRPAGALRP